MAKKPTGPEAEKPDNQPPFGVDTNKIKKEDAPQENVLDSYVDNKAEETIQALTEQIDRLKLEVQIIQQQLGSKTSMTTAERSEKIRSIEDNLLREQKFHGPKRFFITQPRVRTHVVKGKTKEYNWSHIRVEQYGTDKESVTERFMRKTRFTGSGDAPFVVHSEAEHKEFYGSKF